VERVKILLFEDNPGDACLIGEMLEGLTDFRYELKNVETLSEGLNLLKKHQFDIILSDLRLPDKDGIETFLDIHACTPRTPIIILTATNDEKIGIDAVKKGAQDYLVKGQVDDRLLRRSIQYSIERKKAEEKIQILANVVESSEDAIITKSLDGMIIRWNKGAEHIYGYSTEEIQGKNISILEPDNLKGEIKRLIEMIRQGEKISHYETVRLKKDGTLLNVSITLSPVFDSSEELMAISSIARNITGSKKAEEALRLSYRYNRSLIEASLDPLVTIGNDGKITDVNGATEQVTGYSRSELIGTDFSNYFTEPEKAKEGFHYVFINGEIRDYSLEIQHKDGHITPVLYNASVYRDENGEIIGVLAAARDMFELKKAEEFMAKIETARKKEIHHRIKNNLQVISSLLDLQSEKFNNRECIKDAEVLEAFRESQDRVISMALIHEELYKGGGIDTLDFSSYIEKLTDNLFLTYRLGSVDIKLNIDLEENIFFDMDTSVPLGIIINELISNSLKYAFQGRDQGEIRIKIRREENEECISNNQKGAIEDYKGTVFTLVISDNGVGIPEDIDIEDLDSLGLQLVTTLVDQLDGELELKRDKGTELIIKFTIQENKNQALLPSPQLIE
jgi:PAS domain S-box-containing protein